MDANKYSSQKYKHDSKQCTRNNDTEEADQIRFKTFQEYDSEDIWVESVEELQVEMDEFAIPESAKFPGKYSKFNDDIKSMIMKNKLERESKMNKFERAMNYKYPGSQENYNRVRVEKPTNYPLGFKDASQAVDIIEKYEQKSKEREVSKERISRLKAQRCNSKEQILWNSLKQKVIERRSQENSRGFNDRRSLSKSNGKLSKTISKSDLTLTDFKQKYSKWEINTVLDTYRWDCEQEKNSDQS